MRQQADGPPVRPRKCFEATDYLFVIIDESGWPVSFGVCADTEFDAIADKVKSTKFRICRATMPELARLRADDITIVPEVIGVLRPAAITIQEGFATNEGGWFSAKEWAESDELLAESAPHGVLTVRGYVMPSLQESA